MKTNEAMNATVTIPRELVEINRVLLSEMADALDEMPGYEWMANQARALLAQPQPEPALPAGATAIPSMRGCWHYSSPNKPGSFFNCPKCRDVRRFVLVAPDWYRCWSCDYEFGEDAK